MNNSRYKNIIITGSESTGKTSLAEALAEKFQGAVIPEYARTYIQQHGTKYNYNDVETIAKHQWKEYLKHAENSNTFAFFDTFLIVTKVWFIWCYNKYPLWIDKCIRDAKIDLFLVCDADLPWIPDDIRENGGENRNKLLKLYIEEIDKISVPYHVITGDGAHRYTSAFNIIQSYYI